MAKVWISIFIGIFAATVAILHGARLLGVFKYGHPSNWYIVFGFTLVSIFWFIRAYLDYFEIVVGQPSPSYVHLVPGILGLVGGVIILIGLPRMLNK